MLVKKKLLVLRAGELGDGVPKWIQIFPKGEIRIQGEEPCRMDEQAAQTVLSDFRALEHDMVIDYEHQTLTGGQAPAAGWIKELDWREGGLYAHVEWTEQAAEYIRAKEYRYHSPVFYYRQGDRRVVSLYNLALTNQPKMMNVAALAAKNFLSEENEMFLEELKKQLRLSTDSTEEQVMQAVIDLQKKGEPVACKEVLETLGLEKEEQSKEKVVQALKDLQKDEPVACKEALKALDLGTNATKSEVVATIHALKHKPDLTTEVQTLKQKLAQRDRDDLVGQALKQGKITAAQKEWAEDYALKDPEGFKLYVAKAPQVVPVGETQVVGGQGGAHAPAEDQVQLEINKMLGISKEDFNKYGPAKEDI